MSIGGPDPRVPGDRLAALDPGRLRAVAGRIGSVAGILASGCTIGQQAVGELARGWSASSPQIGVGRLLLTAEQAAATLLRHSLAIDGVCAVIERAQFNAHLEFTLAAARIGALQQHSWPEALGGLLGAPQLADGVALRGIVSRLHGALSQLVATVDAAIASLPAALAGDPTAGPDRLRAGPQALLPPDPVANPAHRTDQRNRAALAGDLQSGDPARITFAISILHALQQAGDRAGTAQLVVYDSTAFDGQGRAAVSVGDLTNAVNVAVVVPGIANSPASMSGGIEAAADLRDEAARQSPGEQTAVVAWYGYDIPVSWTKDAGTTAETAVLDTFAAGSAVNAASGARPLAADLSDIRSMSGNAARLTLLGFSMGATTVSEAAQYDLPVDSIVMMGSPGVGWDTDSAAGYHSVPASDIYVLSYDQDPVTLPVVDQLAAEVLRIADPFGPDPASDSFGGRHIDASTNVALAAGGGLIAAILRVAGDPRHHTMKNYMQGRALVAEGSIVVGRDDRVPVKPGR